MAYMIKLQSFSDQRGRLTPVDGVLPFDMVRLYYICNLSEQANRGGHYHKITKEAIFCVNGSFTVVVNNGKTREEFFLNDHTQCVVIEPNEWHMIHNFSIGAILMGVTSTHFDHSDYFTDEPILPQ